MGSVCYAEEPPAQGSFETPVETDPFDVPLSRKVARLLAVNREMCSEQGVSKALSHMVFRREHRLLANSDGTLVESRHTMSTASAQATAVGDGTAKTRSFEAAPLGAGYEHIEAKFRVSEAARVGEEAVRKLHAKASPTGEMDLVLHPSHLYLTMHESVGHALELDRVLGMEESLAGSSFATTDKLGSLRYGSAAMNIVCDNTMPFGLASRGWDDDGVPGQRWHVIRNGVLVDYMTNREVCGAVGAARSHGSCRADSWNAIPILRQSNIGLAPGPEPMTPDALIAGVKRGVYIDGIGAYSIDQRRANFQFGGDCFWEIKDGKLGDMLRDVTYHAMTTAFWGKLDAVCDERFWLPYGVTNCGKGDPMQAAQITHGSAPARFRGVAVRRAGA